MTKTVRATLLGLALLTLAGCSTKNYGRLGEVTDVEAQLYTCRDIALEKARTRGFLARVEDESRFDGRSVLSFLGDLGIGNVTERSYAIESGLSRLSQLEEVRLMRNCPGQFDEAQSSPAAPGPGISTHPVLSSPVLAQAAVAAPSPAPSVQQPATAPATAPAAVVVPAAGAPAAGSPAAAPATAGTTPTVTWVFGPNAHTTVRSTTQQPVRPSLQAAVSTDRSAPASAPASAVPPVSPAASAPVTVQPAAAPPAPATPSSGTPRATLQTAAVAPAPSIVPPPNAVVECGKGTLKVALLGGGWACEREEWVRGLPPPAPARKPRR